jgi:hypothetical protein
MEGINARRIVAAMQNIQSVRYFANMDSVRNTVRSPTFPAKPDGAITMVPFTASPLNAPIGLNRAHSFQSLLDWRIEVIVTMAHVIRLLA